MKALSLTQPWASLVAIGAKQWETRSWSTSYRGQLAIHASKGYPKICRELEYEEPFMSALKRGLTAPSALPLGAIIALGTLIDCQPTSRFREIGDAGFAVPSQYIEVDADELDFGDYYTGRYAFRLENVVALPNPIPCKGALGFWTVPADVIVQIRRLESE